jgi:hypothetical protein
MSKTIAIGDTRFHIQRSCLYFVTIVIIFKIMWNVDILARGNLSAHINVVNLCR